MKNYIFFIEFYKHVQGGNEDKSTSRLDFGGRGMGSLDFGGRGMGSREQGLGKQNPAPTHPLPCL